MSTHAEDGALILPVDEALILEQLEKLVQDEIFRSSRRSVGFLRYVVGELVQGRADNLKERMIGVHVFSRPLTYDTNADHIVRTAASELRKRLLLYYGKEHHRDELQILLLPGSYVPQVRPARQPLREEWAEVVPAREEAAPVAEQAAAEDSIEVPVHTVAPPAMPPHPASSRLRRWLATVCIVAVSAVLLFWHFRAAAKQDNTAELFWKPLVDGSGPVLIAVGDVPHGPPLISGDAQEPTPTPAAPGPPTVPFADAVTIAKIAAILSSQGKEFLIRREGVSSFADLRERPAVLVGAFNNEWSLRLTHNLRFSLALDESRHLLYIRDRQHPEARLWHWSTDPHPEEQGRLSSTPLHDYTLISRVLNSETGHCVLIVGGLYTYGTQAAGEFLASSALATLPREIDLNTSPRVLQIILETQVIDGSAGPPRMVAFSEE